MKNTKLNIFKHKLQWLVLLVALLGLSQGVWASSSVSVGDVIRVDASSCDWFNNDNCYAVIYIGSTMVGSAGASVSNKIYDITITKSATGTLKIKRKNSSGEYNSFDTSDRGINSKYSVNSNCEGGSWSLGDWSFSNKTLYYDNTNTNFTNLYLALGNDNSRDGCRKLDRVTGTQYLYKYDMPNEWPNAKAWFVTNTKWSDCSKAESYTKFVYLGDNNATQPWYAVYSSSYVYRTKSTTSNYTGADSQSRKFYDHDNAIPYDTYDVTISKIGSGTITVEDYDNNTVTSGSSKCVLTVLTITATASSGYTLTSLTVNGNSFTSGNTHIVEKDVAIVATFTASCTNPDKQDVSTDKTSICVSSSETATISCSAQSGYYYQLAKQNGASWNDVGDPKTESSSSVSFTVSAAGTYKVYAYSGSYQCETDMKNTVTITDKAPSIEPSTNIKAYMPVTVTGTSNSTWSITTNPSGLGWLSSSSGATTVFKAPYNASSYAVKDGYTNCAVSISVGQDSETCP